MLPYELAKDEDLYEWQPCTLSIDEQRPFPAVSNIATRFTRAVVRDMSCRVQRVEGTRVTCDSGIRALDDIGLLWGASGHTEGEQCTWLQAVL